MRSLQAMNGIVCTKVAGSINDPPQQRFSERDDSASFDDFIDGLVVVAHLIDQMLPPFDVKSKREKSKKKIKRIHFNDLVSVGVFFFTPQRLVSTGPSADSSFHARQFSVCFYGAEKFRQGTNELVI